MANPWITTNRDRQSEKYRDLHAQLAREVAETERRRESRTRSGKRTRNHIRSEYWRLFAETMTA